LFSCGGWNRQQLAWMQPFFFSAKMGTGKGKWKKQQRSAARGELKPGAGAESAPATQQRRSAIQR